MADKPVTREEKYLAYLTGDYKGELPKPITRKEKYLYELCLKGIGGEISPEEIKAAVNEYLEKNPVKPGATTEQAQQIEQNKADIASLKTETGSLKEDLVNSVDGILSGTRINTIKLDDSEAWEQGVIWSSGANGGENRDVTFGIRTKDFISVNKSGFYEFTVKKMWKVKAIVYNQNYVFESSFDIEGTVHNDYTSQKEFSQEKKYKFYITKSNDSGSTDTSYVATINDCTNITDGVFAEKYEIGYIPKIVKDYIDETKDEKKFNFLKA